MQLRALVNESQPTRVYWLQLEIKQLQQLKNLSTRSLQVQ